MSLTDEQIAEICLTVAQSTPCDIAYARAIEAAVREEQAEPIGEMREGGVTWFGPNPHAFSIGTKFYASPVVPDGMVKDADRYRWIRSNRFGEKLARIYAEYAGGEYLDAAIDEAMIAAAQEEA